MVGVSPENVTVNETMDVLIFCTYDANPVTLTSVQWFKDDVEIIIDGPHKYEGATVDQPALLLKKATRDDAGAYTCRLTNAIGTGQSENAAFISVQCKSLFPLWNLNPRQTIIVSNYTWKAAISWWRLRQIARLPSSNRSSDFRSGGSALVHGTWTASERAGATQRHSQLSGGQRFPTGSVGSSLVPGRRTSQRIAWLSTQRHDHFVFNVRWGFVRCGPQQTASRVCRSFFPRKLLVRRHERCRMGTSVGCRDSSHLLYVVHIPFTVNPLFLCVKLFF